MPTLAEASLWYRVPELLLGGAELAAAIDVLAFGASLFELATGEVLV